MEGSNPSVRKDVQVQNDWLRSKPQGVAKATRARLALATSHESPAPSVRMRGKIILITTVLIVLISFVSAINVNNRLLDQHNEIVKDQKIFDLKKFNTYLIPDTKPSPIEELHQTWIKNKDKRQYRIQKEQEREQLEKELAKKSKRWVTIIGNDVYYGFDEEIYGSKEFYFYWK